MAEVNWAQLKAEVIAAWQDGRIVPDVNVFRWREGSQSNGALFSVTWTRPSTEMPYKLDFKKDHAALYGAHGLIDHVAADMTTFCNTLAAAMPWPEEQVETETGTLDDAYNGLLELE